MLQNIQGFFIVGRFWRTTDLPDQRDSHVSSRHHFVRKELCKTRLPWSVHQSECVFIMDKSRFCVVF